MYLERLKEIKTEYNLSNSVFLLAQKFIETMDKHDIIASRITDLYEDGYAFQFIKNKSIEVWFEIYDDGEYGYIAFDRENNYQLIANEDVLDFNQFIEFMKL